MLPYNTNKEYFECFRMMVVDAKRNENNLLDHYLDKQFQKLEQLTAAISPETFWNVFPEILGIDARLNLLTDLVSFDDFSNEEIIRIVEKDYRNYLTELCGYNLKVKTYPSMVFNIV